MDEDTRMLIKIITMVIIGVFLLLFLIGFIVYELQVNITEANIIQIYKDDTLIYKGKKAFVEITSGGMTTTITVYRQLFPFNITDKVYSGANIKVETEYLTPFNNNTEAR